MMKGVNVYVIFHDPDEMDIITETLQVINKKTAMLQRKETEWKEKQGGQLEGWQITQLENGIKDIQLFQRLISAVQAARQTEEDRKEELLIEIMNKSYYQKLTTARDYRDTLLDDLEREFTKLEARYNDSKSKWKSLYWTVIIKSGMAFTVKKYRELKAQYHG